jgi:hypothetical protein
VPHTLINFPYCDASRLKSTGNRKELYLKL